MIYEVIICGGGPAGAYAGYALAHKGRKVAIVEKERYPRTKPCGGILRPAIIDFRDVVRKIGRFDEGITYAASVHSPSGKYTMRYRSSMPLAYNVRREKFDASLAEMAKDAGVDFFEGESVKKVGYIGEKGEGDVKVEFVLTGGKSIFGKFAIGAGGVRCPVGKFLREREKIENSSNDSLGFAVVSECEVGEEFIAQTYGKDFETHIFFKEYKGYGWVFPKRNVVNFGIGAYWRDARRHNMMREARGFAKNLVKMGLIPRMAESKIRFKGGLLPLGQNRGRISTERILLVGDAAGFASPLTGEGIYYAIQSGKIASEVLNNALDREKRGEISRDYLYCYERECNEKFGRELEDARSIANMVFSKPEMIVKYSVNDVVLQNCFAECFSVTSDLKKVRRRALVSILKHIFFG